MSLDIDRDGAPHDGPAAGQLLRDLGVEPIINCTGVRTSYGGCSPTRSVLVAMEASARSFVIMNELAEAIGRKLAALTGAEWGLVTAGTAAAVSQAVAACVAGNDPEKMLKLPLRGERVVVVAADQRMAYQHAIRGVGCRCFLSAVPQTWNSFMRCCLGYSQVSLVVRTNRSARQTAGNSADCRRGRSCPKFSQRVVSKWSRSTDPFRRQVHQRTAIHRLLTWLGKIMQSCVPEWASWRIVWSINEGW